VFVRVYVACCRVFARGIYLGDDNLNEDIYAEAHAEHEEYGLLHQIYDNSDHREGEHAVASALHTWKLAGICMHACVCIYMSVSILACVLEDCVLHPPTHHFSYNSSRAPCTKLLLSSSVSISHVHKHSPSLSDTLSLASSQSLPPSSHPPSLLLARSLAVSCLQKTAQLAMWKAENHMIESFHVHDAVM